MAAIFVNAVAKSIGTQSVEVYVAPSKAVVIGGNITNKLSSTVPVNIILRKGVDDIYVQQNRRIFAGEPFELNQGNKLVLNAGDKLIVSALVDSSIDVVFSLLQGVS